MVCRLGDSCTIFGATEAFSHNRPHRPSYHPSLLERDQCYGKFGESYCNFGVRGRVGLFHSCSQLGGSSATRLLTRPAYFNFRARFASLTPAPPPFSAINSTPA